MVLNHGGPRDMLHDMTNAGYSCPAAVCKNSSYSTMIHHGGRDAIHLPTNCFSSFLSVSRYITARQPVNLLKALHQFFKFLERPTVRAVAERLVRAGMDFEEHCVDPCGNC